MKVPDDMFKKYLIYVPTTSRQVSILVSYLKLLFHYGVKLETEEIDYRDPMTVCAAYVKNEEILRKIFKETIYIIKPTHALMTFNTSEIPDEDKEELNGVFFSNKNITDFELASVMLETNIKPHTCLLFTNLGSAKAVALIADISGVDTIIYSSAKYKY